jgi:alkylhydroperoxidase family enzyme
MSPRIEPGRRSDIGLVNTAIAHVLGAATGGRPPNLFTTLARHRGIYRKWLRFAGALMPGGKLPRDESEIVILRVAHNCACEYEWRHHERLGAQAGLSTKEIDRVKEGAGAGWSDRRAALIRATDELHAGKRISDATWADLRPLYSDEQLIELCLLAGHYEMLAGTLNSLGVEPDKPHTGKPTVAMRIAGAFANRR